MGPWNNLQLALHSKPAGISQQKQTARKQDRTALIVAVIVFFESNSATSPINRSASDLVFRARSLLYTLLVFAAFTMKVIALFCLLASVSATELDADEQV